MNIATEVAAVVVTFFVVRWMSRKWANRKERTKNVL